MQAENVRQYCVYVLTNVWRTVLYTGMTNALKRRVWEHKNRHVPGFTKQYNCDRLVYYDTFTEVNDAIAAEKRIKGWSRWKKIALIEQNNPEWEDLAAAWFVDLGAGDPSLRSG